jgi:tetratricopeptide (TPR) repeat protein
MKELLMHSLLKQLALTVMLCWLSAATVHAKPYGAYEPSKIVQKNASGPGGSLDMGYVDTMLQDLRTHAESYPTQFDNEDDKARARRDLIALLGMLEVIGKEPNAPIDIWLRLGILGHMGYNLEIPRTGDAALFYITKVLDAQPKHPMGNYRMGLFLAQSNRLSQAVNFLENAKSLGYSSALYSLGLTYLSLKDNAKALENLSAYQSLYPNDHRTAQLIEAIKQGNVHTNETVKK